MKLRISNERWVSLSRDKLKEKFGPKAVLGRFELAPHALPKDLIKNSYGDLADDVEPHCGRWAILEFSETGNYNVVGCGSTPKRALERAGLGGWVGDTLDKLQAQAANQEAAV